MLALAPWQDARAETASKPPDYLLIEAIVPVAKAANWWTKRHDEKVRAAGAGDVGMIMIGDSLVHNFETRCSMIIAGVMAIRQGLPWRVVDQKLASFYKP